MNDKWMHLSGIGGKQSKLRPATWPYDKYPQMEQLKAKTKITILDEEGPGVISCIHSTTYYGSKKGILKDDRDSSSLIIRIWYDGNDKPDIEMPFMDFLGDVESSCNFFSTLYFSKTPHAHNFRLPIPFKKHIKIEVENVSDENLTGYMDIQWEKLDVFPENCGYLYADYRASEVNTAKGHMELCNVDSTGAIVAHWLQIQADDELCEKGELLCEANNEIYIDGEEEPSMEYLGTEDYYGYSWGFYQLHSDFYTAITKLEELPKGGSLVAVLRCRDLDRICFNKSCRVVMNYEHERNWRVEKAREKGGIIAKYVSCYYYYK